MKKYFFINGGEHIYGEGCCEKNETTGRLPISVERLALETSKPITTSFSPSINQQQRDFLKKSKIVVGDQFFFGLVPQEHLLSGLVHTNFGILKNALTEVQMQFLQQTEPGNVLGLKRLVHYYNRRNTQRFNGYLNAGYKDAVGLKYKIVLNWVQETPENNCGDCYEPAKIKFLTQAEATVFGAAVLPSVAAIGTLNAEVDKPKTWLDSKIFVPFGMAIAIGIEFTALPQETVNGVSQDVSYINDYDFQAEIGFLVNDMRTNLTGQ